METAKSAGMINNNPPPAPLPPKKETFDLKPPTMPDVSGMSDPVEINKAMAKYTEDLNEFHNKQREWDKKEIQDSVKQAQLDSRAREVNKFASDPKRKKHFQNKEVFVDIERFFNTGDDIESAYNKALKLHDIKGEEGEKKEEETSPSKPKISNLSTTGTGTPKPSSDSGEREAPSKKSSLSDQLDVASAAERAYDKLIESNPEMAKDLE